jgi:2'-5' RNA ligase superfamily
MYWIIGLFDKKTEVIIENIWRELKNNSIADPAEEIRDARPHITIGSYYELNKEEYINLFDKFYKDKPRIDISFNTIGSFMNYKTLFLSPTMTRELMNFHSDHHAYFQQFNGKANTYYLPDNWIPHCTLVNKVSDDKLTEAFSYCLKNHQTINGRIVEVAIIELIGENNNCIEAPIIYSKSLVNIE